MCGLYARALQNVISAMDWFTVFRAILRVTHCVCLQFALFPVYSGFNGNNQFIINSKITIRICNMCSDPASTFYSVSDRASLKSLKYRHAK